MTETNTAPAAGFYGLGISPKLLATLDKLNFKVPTPIQMKAIPVAAAGTDMVGVTYKTAGQQMQDVLAGRIQWIVAAPPQLESFVKAGKLRIVAVDGVGRYPLWPDVPSIGETFPGYRTSGMGILAGPRGLPQSVIQPLNAAMDKINRDPEYQKQLLNMSFQVTSAGTPETINAFIRERRQYWNTIFKALNVQPE